MAGLPEYLGYGFAIAGLYIGAKYGAQIVNNLKGSQPPAAQAQTPSSQTTGTPADQTPDLTYAPETHGVPNAVIAAAQKRGGRPVKGHINPILGDETLDTPPAHNYPAHKKMIDHPSVRKPPVPSGMIKERPSTSFTPPSSVLGTGPCPDGSFPDKNNNCKPIPTYLANIGYFNGYETPWTGPQWRKTIPYREVIASQGMAIKQGRVKRALAAGNHEFIPAGFVLSESSVRRGYDNVYSAGT